MKTSKELPIPIRLLYALAAAAIAWKLAMVFPQGIVYDGIEIGDVGIPLVGMMQWLDGQSAYDIYTVRNEVMVGYPFPSMFFVVPFLFVPLQWVVPLFCAIVSGVLAYALLHRNEVWRLLTFLAFPYISAIHSAQWSPLITAIVLLPGLAPLAMAKPNLGLVAALLGRWRWWGVGLVLGLVGLSFILYPTWPQEWLRGGGVGDYDGWMPLLTGPGFLLALALLRWPSRNAKLLFLMSLAPQRLWYDQLPVFLVARSWWELIILVIGSWASIYISRSLGWVTQLGPYDGRSTALVVCLVYLPALVMVLRASDDAFDLWGWLRSVVARKNKKNGLTAGVGCVNALPFPDSEQVHLTRKGKKEN